jgi:hypothetical protein
MAHSLHHVTKNTHSVVCERTKEKPASRTGSLLQRARLLQNPCHESNLVILRGLGALFPESWLQLGLFVARRMRASVDPTQYLRRSSTSLVRLQMQ